MPKSGLRAFEVGQGEGFGFGRVLVDGGDDLAAIKAALGAGTSRQRGLFVGWGIERDDNLKARLRAEDFDALATSGLGAADEAQLPAVGEIGDDAGEPIGTEGRVAVDQGDDAQRLGLEQIAAGDDAVAADIEQAAAADVGEVADV